MRIWYPLILIFFFIACQPPVDDLASKRETLKTKKAELRALEKEIASLADEIESLDTTSKRREPSLVTTIPVEKKNFEREVEIQAHLEADNIVFASSETGGRLMSVTADEGDYVKKGQLVASVDLESIDKQIAEVETALSLAKDVYDRQKRLWEQNIGSEIQYLEAKNNVERLEKSLETLRFQLTKSSVYSPISGIVETKVLDAGEMSSPGAPILQILDVSRVKAVASAPENYLKILKKGKSVTIEIPALESRFEAKISKVGRTIDPSNRTFDVEVMLSNKNGLLKPNLLAYMIAVDHAEEGVVVVSSNLVQQDLDGKKYVFIEGKDEIGPVASKVYVETGESNGDQVIVKSGLTGKEKLIEKGARSLMDNDPIKIQNVNEPIKQLTNG